MKKQIVYLCISVLVLGGTAVTTYATPLYPLTNNSQGGSLVVVCGIADEFDPSHTLTVPIATQKDLTSEEPEIDLFTDSTGLNDSAGSVPEASTLILVGLGLLGLAGIVRQRNLKK